MKQSRFSCAAAIILLTGITTPVFSAQGNDDATPRNEVILLAQVGSNIPRTVSRDEAIAKASKVKPGNVVKATLEKRDDQIVWEVMIADSARTSAVHIDSKTGDVIKTVQVDK